VVRFRSQPVLSAQDLIAKVSATSPDQSVDIEYLRETGSAFQRHTTQIRLGERPVTREAALDQPEPVKLSIDKKEDPKPLGLTLDELTPALAATYKLEGQKGVLVKEINPDSYIADVKASNGLGAAIDEGDLIQRVNGISITDRRSFDTTAAKLRKGDAVVLHVLTFSSTVSRPVLKVVQFTVQ
jgi:S1-C subfamily serine protease